MRFCKATLGCPQPLPRLSQWPPRRFGTDCCVIVRNWACLVRSLETVDGSVVLPQGLCQAVPRLAELALRVFAQSPLALQRCLCNLDGLPRIRCVQKDEDAITVRRMNAPMPGANRSSAGVEKTFRSRWRSLATDQSPLTRKWVSIRTFPR